MARNTARELAELSKELRRLGDKGLRKDLYRGLQRDVGKPMKAAAQEAARSALPSKGGLAARGAAASWRTSLGRAGAVRFQGSERKAIDLDRIDRTGKIVAPLFGNRGRWHTQSIAPGFLARPLMIKAEETVRKAVEKILDDIGRKLKA